MANQALLIAARYSLEGYPWGCTCGESHKTEDAAMDCRKCERYLSWADFKGRRAFFMDPREAHHILLDAACAENPSIGPTPEDFERQECRP